MKDLVNKAAQVAPLLKITRDDINNKVRNIQGPRKQRDVSPVIPYHAIGCPTLSTISDSNISTGLISERTSAENPLDILANQAGTMTRVPSRSRLQSPPSIVVVGATGHAVNETTHNGARQIQIQWNAPEGRDHFVCLQTLSSPPSYL